MHTIFFPKLFFAFVCFKISPLYVSGKKVNIFWPLYLLCFALLQCLPKTPVTVWPESTVDLKWRTVIWYLLSPFTWRQSSQSRQKYKCDSGTGTFNPTTQYSITWEKITASLVWARSGTFWIYIRKLRSRKENFFRNFYHSLMHFLLWNMSLIM